MQGKNCNLRKQNVSVIKALSKKNNLKVVNVHQYIVFDFFFYPFILNERGIGFGWTPTSGFPSERRSKFPHLADGYWWTMTER